MRLRLDPWAADYDTAYHAVREERVEGAERVDPDVETPAASWAPIDPPPAAAGPRASAPPPWSAVLFLDGGRRIEARVLLEDERRQVAFGALGSFGVGAVATRAWDGGAPAAFVLAGDAVRRVCALSSGFTHADLLLPALRGGRGDLAYEVVATQESDPDAVVRAIQNEMRSAEARLAARLAAAHPEALVVCDGPRPLLGAGANVLGYIKTIHDPRIPPELLDVVRRLERGQRSPVYLVRSRDPKHAVFEWFLRLRDPRPWLYSLAGMVRLQAWAGPDPAATLPAALERAAWSAAELPRFASRAHQDPRAPQQLLPVRALEAELRRRMGHPQILRRRIADRLSREGGPA